MAAWASDNTATDAVFLVDNGDFRMFSRRAIVAADPDVRYVYYLAPWRLGEWMDRSGRQSVLLRQPDADGLQRLVNDLARQEDLAGAREWYVVLLASVAPEKTQGLEPVSSDRWGQVLRLYRLRPPPTPASQPASAQGGNQ